MVRIRLEARICRLLSRAARRLRTRQHHQRATHRPAQARARRAQAAAAAGPGPQGNLAGPQGVTHLLPDPAVLGGQSRAAQADRPDGQGAGVRRADGRDRAVAGRPDAAGAARPRCPAVAGLADGAVAHRPAGSGQRRGGGTRRQAAAHRRTVRRDPGLRWLRPRPRLAQGAAARGGAGLELRQPGRDGGTASGPAKTWAPQRTCSTRRGGSRPSNGRTGACNSCSTSG